MSLAMARPSKHSATGMYWLRRRVPTDLVAVLGKREEKISLKTKDPVEAKKRFLAALAEMEARWANLRSGPVTLTEREAHEIAFELYDRWIEMHSDEPSSQTRWRPDLFEALWSLPTAADFVRPLYEVDQSLGPRLQMEALAFDGADTLLQRRGLRVDAGGREKLAKAVAAVIQRASLDLARQGRGERNFPANPAQPSVVAADTPRSNTTTGPKALTFEQAVDLWIVQRRPAEKSIYEWRRVLRQLQAFLKHGDAHRLTVDDLIEWKTSMMEAGLAPKTIRDAKIAPVRAILQCAVNDRKLPANPAEKIVIDVRTKMSEARRGYTDKEAAIILKAAMTQADSVLRWVPWICAYSGARVSEVCQLRGEDVFEQDGIWCVRFAAEAGPLKNANSERAIPLHPALIESGFVTFAQKVRTGPIFKDLPPDKFGKRGGNGTKVLGPFVRSLALTDERLAPNHSWRHRFKTLGRHHGLALDLVNAITGHGHKSVADAYGAYPMTALHRELVKIPALDLELKR